MASKKSNEAELAALESSEEETEEDASSTEQVKAKTNDTEGYSTGLPSDEGQLEAAKLYHPARVLANGASYSVLLMAALPKGEKHISVHKELARIQQCLLQEDKAERFALQITPSIEAGTFAQTIFKSFRGRGDKLHLLHISCHGDTGTDGNGVLVFDDGSEVKAADVIGPENCRNLHGVFLNACHSGLMKEGLLKKGVAFVISCNQPVEDTAALPFAQCFYERLFAGQSLHDAFSAAEIYLKSCLDLSQGKRKGKIVIELHCNAALLLKLVKHKGSKETLQQDAGAEEKEKALAEEILALLEGAQSAKLIEGQMHVKATNFKEAQECFEAVAQAPKSVSPAELAKAKLLLVYTRCKIGARCLKDRKFAEAAEILSEALDGRPDSLSDKRLQKLQLLHACALYEAGKQHREDGDWGQARKCFEAAKKTKKLPDELQKKNATYLKECKQMCDDMEDKHDSLDESDDADLIDEANSDEAKAFEMYKQAKRSMENGMANQSRQQFKEAREIGLSKALKKRAKKFVRALEEYEGQEATQCVFSDNCTHLLSSSTVTLGFSKATLALSTQTISTGRGSSKDLVMVLDEIFPAGSTERSKLIVQLRTDVRKALASLSKATEIEIIDLVRGSVIVHFRFVSNDSDHTGFLEEEYLKQVDDKKSALYKGGVTRRIDQQRTQTMTMQLDSSSADQALCLYRVGDTITLAQVQEETIDCQVESLLGEGATATVFRVSSGGKICALKVFKAENSLEDLCTEASLLLSANYTDSHPNVLRADFVWYEQHTHEMFFLLELATGGDLQAWMDDERLYAGTEEERQERLASIVDQIARGQRHLHGLGILHQDNKPENVLMTEDGRALLADLGVANEGVVEEGWVRATLRGGTPVYASPHVRQLFFQAKALPVTDRADFLQQRPITHLDDFFALGATILDMYAECGWRRGKSVADVLVTAGGDVAQLLRGIKLQVVVPQGVLKVLKACFAADATLTIDSIVTLTSKFCSNVPSATEATVGLTALRSVNIRNNLGVALFDSGVIKQEQGQKDAAARCFCGARSELEQAIVAHSGDARTLNNLGVVRWAQGEAESAKGCFDDALEEEPDHLAATFNIGLLQSGRDWTTAQVDRSGAAGAVEDGRGKVELANAVSYAPGQQLEVHRHGKWKRVRAGDLGDKPLINLMHRVLAHEALEYTPEQLLLMDEGAEWRL
eukprot:g2268.t1